MRLRLVRDRVRGKPMCIHLWHESRSIQRGMEMSGNLCGSADDANRQRVR